MVKNLKKTIFILLKKSDIPIWMDLMRSVIDGYPVMNEEDYLKEITRHIEEKHALVLKDDGVLVGAMDFSDDPSCIDFLGIHPQYRKQDIQKLFLDVLLETYLPRKKLV